MSKVIPIKKQKTKASNPSPETEAHRLARGNDQVATDGGGTLYRWTGSYWQPQSSLDAETAMFSWLSSHPEHVIKASPRLAASCVVAAAMGARRLPVRSEGDTETSLILPLLNGYLHINLQGGEITLQDPAPDAGLTYQLQVSFDPAAQADRFHQFLADILPDQEVREFIQEYIGYTLISDCRFQIAMFWVGSGANGKSTLASIIAKLHRNTASMSIDKLEGFRLTPLVGASLVYVDETPPRVSEQALKKIISGGLIEIDRKFRDPISFKPTAKWIILGNNMPAVSDQSHGFWRRAMVAPFGRQFTDTEKDPLLEAKIITTEMAGVLNWAITGLVRLMARGRFPGTPEPMRAAQRQGMLESNSVYAWWIDARAEIHPEVETPRALVYADYRKWATDNGMAPVSAERFWPRLDSACGQKIVAVARKVDGASVRFVPVRLLHSHADGEERWQ